VQPGLTASQLGLGWQQKSGYLELDGLWPLVASVHGKYLLVGNDPELIETMLANFNRKSDYKPAELLAGLNHQRERANFARFTGLVDRPSVGVPDAHNNQHQPQFFSENMTSLSRTLSGVSAERIEVRSEGGKVRQTVTYEWSK
jgi:hypothetical protein